MPRVVPSGNAAAAQDYHSAALKREDYDGIEFLTGISPADASGSAAFTTTLDPPRNLVLHFKRVDAAKACTVAVDSSTNLQPPWASQVVPNNATVGSSLTVVEKETAADDITGVVPVNDSLRKFAGSGSRSPSSFEPGGAHDPVLHRHDG